MIELRIDSVRCDLPADHPVRLSWNDSRLIDPEAGRSGESLCFEIASTPETDTLFGNECHLYRLGSFNASHHTGELVADGVPLVSGHVRLIGIRWRGSRCIYRIELRSGGYDWTRQALRQPIGDLEVAASVTFTPEGITQGWEGESAVRFLPVVRGAQQTDPPTTGIRPPERILSTDDFHPFISIYALVLALFRKAGYTVSSIFFASGWFRSLHMSGAYAAHNLSNQMDRMGFLARRKSEVSTSASASGRVDADPYVSSNSVGNLFDAFTPMESDETGNILTDTYSAGGCLRMEEGELTFRPLGEVSVGFEYALHYTTGYRILSRSRLSGIDTIGLGSETVHFELANPFEDRRTSVRSLFNYRVVVFNHNDGNRWSLRATVNGANFMLAEFSGRSIRFNTPQATQITNLRLYRSVDGVQPYALYNGDWALYDGYIGETGQTEVRITIRTSPERLSPTVPKYFRHTYFSGGEAGTSFTLHRDSTLRPCFSTAPGYGSQVSFGDVAHHEISQMELLQALGHLFDLRFFTDEVHKKIYIEPACDFYDTANSWDWSDRIAEQDEIAGRDRALEIHDHQGWGYRKGDAAVQRFDEEHDTRIGYWSHDTPSKAAMEGSDESLNPIFAPTLSERGRSVHAPSAALLRFDEETPLTGDTGQITPRIVRYLGMRQLPAGERWGYPTSGTRYPLAAFHLIDSAAEGSTLCFEDRDGLQGIHRFRDARLAAIDDRQLITLPIRIRPDEYVALFRPDGGSHPTIRSIFRLRMAGGRSLFTLHAVEQYDPRCGVALCTFERLSND